MRPAGVSYLYESMSPSSVPDIKEVFASDEVFDALYPIYISSLSAIHWTPMEVAAKAAVFLAPDANARVIDIGSGVGKFCIAGAHFAPGHFTGIEQRANFVKAGNKVARQLGMERVSLQHGNFMDMDLGVYTGIYFYNSFHENIVHDDALDQKVDLSSELYEQYTDHLLRQLNQMPVGTRLATYWLSIPEIPACYREQGSYFGDLLKLWIKEY